jgi:conjugative transfer signal peptidase TraF
MATISVVIAIVLTTVTAIATLAAKTLNRAVYVTVVGAVIALAVVSLQSANLRINFTGSMPIGIYLLLPLPTQGVKRDMLVAACAPAGAASIGLRRGYLVRGPCAEGAELLLKSVAATAGDEVDVTASGVAVNGCSLPHSRPTPRDRSSRTLVAWPRGRDRVVSDQVWLYAADDRSWDSRYWGPASVGEIEDEAIPLLVISGSHLARGRSGRIHPATGTSETPGCNRVQVRSTSSEKRSI